MLKNHRPDLLYLGIVILMILLAAGLTWGNYQYTLENPGGNDFVSRWLGTRLYLTEGISPYSDEATLRIQEYFYGRKALPNEDQQLFVYPFYSMLFFSPFSLIENFSLARAVWMTVLEIGILAISFSSMAAMRWKPGKGLLIFFLIFSMLWYHALRPIINGNPAILAALFISLAFFMVHQGRFSMAGILFAFSTIKPQMVILLIPFVMWWALTRRKKQMILSFFVSLSVLIGVSIFLQPDWILKNLWQVFAYSGYTQAGTPIGIFMEWGPGIGDKIGIGLTIFLVLILVVEWIAASKKDEQWFLWTACLTLVVTNLIGIRTSTANYIALMPALILVFSVFHERWGKASSRVIFIYLLTLLIGLWWLFVATLIRSDQPWQHPVLFFPLPVLLFLSLYWVRHWKLGSPRMQIEELNALRRL